jgi:hypothetical protein
MAGFSAGKSSIATNCLSNGHFNQENGQQLVVASTFEAATT